MINMPSVYLGLLHYPIYNKNGEIITSAVTNFDIHDIARSSRTYNIKRYFVIHPLASQRELVKEIMDHWQTGLGAEYNPDRKEALDILELAESLEMTVRCITEAERQAPVIVTTDARCFPNTVSYGQLRRTIETGTRPCLILFGTGWGIEKSVMQQFDYILEPVLGPGDYNHLSVRSAVAIILDRLLGEPWWLERDR
ncbi:RNA methyltransferase [Acetonema longum]|uniref:tRNA (guanine-N(1)-)-methyltransferase C-terminal domain-containing protein n=1 Tax=Acetonema longum DSM 6540 TaxID=1009370 RepID=F7NFP5_9FIRM|nr:RNA methyltransferase [Acetonema longum]EGO65168.1 hypothetical protein ALO_04371 [Acetonema longum DSM 6540]